MFSRIKLFWVPQKHTYCSHVINIGTFGSNDPPEAFFLGSTVGFVQVGLAIAVYHAPFTIQHTKAVPARKTTLNIPESGVMQGRAHGLGHQIALRGSMTH